MKERKIFWTPEKDTYLRKHYATALMTNMEYILDTTAANIYKRAFVLGLKRDFATKDKITRFLQSEHLCWKCKYATNKYTGYCSWAHNLTPVKGWETIKQFHCKKSFFVVKCPIFEVEIKNTVSGTDEK